LISSIPIPFNTVLHAPPRISVTSTVGVLVELRFTGSALVQDVVKFEARLQMLVRRIMRYEKRRPVICTDLRGCTLLQREVSERVIRLIRHDSPHVERHAFLGKDDAPLSLQVRKTIEESGVSDRRRMFADAKRLLAWLEEVTNPAERARLRLFLASGPLTH
jgi:hypothetical protein